MGFSDTTISSHGVAPFLLAQKRGKTIVFEQARAMSKTCLHQ